MRSQALAIPRTGTSQRTLPLRSRAMRERTFDPDRVVDADADPPHDREELFMDAEAGSAACQIAAGAFEYGDLPPDGAQQVRREQPAHRSADHQGARPIQLAPPSFSHMQSSPRLA